MTGPITAGRRPLATDGTPPRQGTADRRAEVAAPAMEGTASARRLRRTGPVQPPDAAGLAISIHHVSGVTVCAVVGAVDDGAVLGLVDALRAAFRVRPGRLVVLDLSGVRWLVPRGVNAVIGAARHARQRGDRLLVCDVPPRVVPGVQVHRLRVLSVFPDVRSAIAAVTGGPREPDALATGSRP